MNINDVISKNTGKFGTVEVYKDDHICDATSIKSIDFYNDYLITMLEGAEIDYSAEAEMWEIMDAEEYENTVLRDTPLYSDNLDDSMFPVLCIIVTRGFSNKAQFRALREACGISQAVAAGDIGVDIRTIKRWEGPDAHWVVPDDAMAYIVEVYEDHMRAVSSDVDAAHKLLEQEPEGGRHKVQLTYYRTQEEYEACTSDEGYFGVANACVRAIGEQLEADGVQVRYVFPGDEGIHTPGSRY